MAGEINIINEEDLKAPLELAANYKKLANDFDALAASSALLMKKVEDQEASIKDLSANTKQLEKEVKKLEAANKKAAKSSESMAAAAEYADDATGGFVSKVKALTKQMWALIATPVGAFLGAIVVALAAVSVYFKNSNEGADKFERIMAAIGGISDFLLNKITDLGEQIVKLFEDGNFLGDIFIGVFNRLLNMVSGVIDSFTNVLRVVNTLSKYKLKDLLFGDIKPEDAKELEKAFNDLGRSTIQAITGIGTAADEVAAKIKSLDKLVQEGQALGDEIRNRILSKAQAELQIEKLLFDAKDKTHKTDQQRLDALKQAVQLSQDQLKIELDIAVRKERHFTAELLHSKEIIKNEEQANIVLKQGTTAIQDQLLEQKASDEQLEERKKLQAEVFNLQRAYFAENKKAIGQISALEKEINDEIIKNAELQVKARIKALDELLAKGKEIEGRQIVGLQTVYQEQVKLNKNFGERLIADAKARDEAEKEREKKRLERLKEQQEKERIIRESAIVAVGMAGDAIFDRRQERLAEESALIEQKRADELKAAGDDERAKLAINRKFDREQARIKTKQAQADKQAAIFGIIINTALGIMKAAPVVPLMIATGILGALQLALVASKPIPKFALGTESSPDTFIAGEKGRELVSHKGKLSIADRATLFTGMLGARVFSNPATEEILGGLEDAGPAMNYGNRVRARIALHDHISAGLYESNKWLKKIANKQEAGLAVDEHGFHKYLGKVQKRNQRIAKRFY